MIGEPDNSADARLNRHLAVLKQAYERLLSICPLDRLGDFVCSDDLRRPLAEELLQTLIVHGDAAEKILQHAATGEDSSLFARLSPSMARFYDKHFRPNREAFQALYWNSVFGELDLGDAASSSAASRYGDSEETSVLSTIRAAIESQEWRAEDNPDWPYEITCFDEAKQIVDAGFFKPDIWLENLGSVRPVVADRASHDYPRDVRILVKELFRSFVFGNYLAVCALARAVVEYALLDRAAAFGVDAYEVVGEKRYPKPLNHLLELYQPVVAPALYVALDSVRELGNRALHKSKHHDVSGLPALRRKNALESLGYARQALSFIYARSAELRS